MSKNNKIITKGKFEVPCINEGEINKSNRRTFLKTSVLGALGTISVPAILGSCSNSTPKEDKLKNVVIHEILDKAPDGKPLKAGLIGCGDRGTGAAVDFISAGNGLEISAIGDIFKEKLDASREILKEKGQNIPDEKCFIGFDAYQKVIDSGVDVVLLCTPPVFRPLHFEYAVKAGKDCFIEKPVAVDPVGARKMLVAGKRAAQQNLSAISGTVWRSSKGSIETYKRIAGGAIGKLLSAHVTRFGGTGWHKNREKGWSDMEYMMRNWLNFAWISGDLLCEQFIHEIDLMSWFHGDVPPLRAKATGGRARRLTGDVYDFFSVEYEYEDGFRAHCTSRQINGCDNMNEIMLYGTKGWASCRGGTGEIFNLDGSTAWKYEPAELDGLSNAYVLEHVRLVTAIRTGKPINDIESQVLSTVLGIMGREAAYTGKFVTYDEIMASELKLGPETYEFGPIPGIIEEIPLPGIAPKA